MRIRLGTLRRIIKEEASRARQLLEATGDEGFEVVDAATAGHLEVGNSYLVDGMPGLQVFVGWSEEGPGVLNFRDAQDGDEWEAFLDGETYCWGSDSTPLKVSDEHAEEYAAEEAARE